jgi:hypothetical protein
MKISEEKLKKIIGDLKDKGLITIDLGSGTFDLLIDEGKRPLLELKVANLNYKKWAKTKGIRFTEQQTQEIRKMRNLPIVFACDENDIKTCYLIEPKKLERLSKSKERRRKREICVGIKYLEQISYRKALDRLSNFIY